MSTAKEQIRRLAHVIAEEIPGEPSESEGAVDTAIRLLRRAYEPATTAAPSGSSADAGPEHLAHVDDRLLWLLHRAGEEWGPLGVALAAAHMTDPAVLVERLRPLVEHAGARRLLGIRSTPEGFVLDVDEEVVEGDPPIDWRTTATLRAHVARQYREERDALRREIERLATLRVGDRVAVEDGDGKGVAGVVRSWTAAPGGEPFVILCGLPDEDARPNPPVQLERDRAWQRTVETSSVIWPDGPPPGPIDPPRPPRYHPVG